MRLLQLNAWTLRLSTNVADMIRQEAPDVVALQEIPESTLDTMLFPTLTEFMHTVRFHHTYFSPTCSIRFMSGELEFGNAIISNLTLHDQHTVFTNLAYKAEYSSGTDDYNIRNFQHIITEDENGKKFHLINHHGYHVPEHKRGDNFTLKACQEILEYTKGLDGAVIITGDFNLAPDSESITLFDEQFRNLSTEYGFTTTRNNFTKKSEVCDYIFVNDHVAVNEFYMSDIIASDHQGLVLDFDIT